MWILRTLGILDVQANIMSLAGITISIGILVDQAIVMTENATHHLKAHFGDQKVTVTRPRLRQVEQGEVPLQSSAWLRAPWGVLR